MQHIKFETDLVENKERLDKYIQNHLEKLTRSFIARLIKNKNISVNGKNKKPGYIIKSGDKIEIIIPDEEPLNFDPEPIPLNILFEDEYLIIINKPPKLVVHPSPGHKSGTLINALLYHSSTIKGVGNERHGIVHRLDQDTTGCIVVAKTNGVHLSLSNAFQARKVKKNYIALVHGTMQCNSGIINSPIGRHPIERKKMAVNTRNSKKAETRWKILKTIENLSLVDVEIKTGRTHQIRVHFESINHPVIGDPLYGYKRINKNVPPNMSKFLLPIKRQMLHSWKLGFNHPITKEFMLFEAPIPEDMQKLLNDLCLGAGKK